MVKADYAKAIKELKKEAGVKSRGKKLRTASQWAAAGMAVEYVPTETAPEEVSGDE